MDEPEIFRKDAWEEAEISFYIFVAKIVLPKSYGALRNNFSTLVNRIKFCILRT